MDQAITTPKTKGLLISLILIVISLAIYFAGIKMNGGVQWVGYVIFIAAIIFSIAQYGRQVNHHATFGNYFSHGFKTAAIVTVIMIIFGVVFILLFPEFKEQAMEEARKNMQGKKLSEEQMNTAIEVSRKFFMVFLIAGSLVSYLLAGVIASLIGAAIVKKVPNNFEQQINQIT